MATVDRYKNNGDGITFRDRTKQARQKRLFNTLKRLYIVIAAWALVIGYLVSPYSKARINNITGNQTILSQADIYEIGNFNSGSFWWAVDENTVEQRLNAYKFISSADITIHPLGLEVELFEISVVAKYGSDCLRYGDACTFILSNGNEVEGKDNFNSLDVKHIASFGSVPNVIESNLFSQEQLSVLYALLGRVSREVRNGIISIKKSEITTTTVVDIILSGAYYNLDNDLQLVIDLGSLDAKLKTENILIISESIRLQNPPLKNGNYCYIYRASDYALPCE
jgi:cell division septal protein FtsQ